jgi:alpha,alpha-trehalase
MTQRAVSITHEDGRVFVMNMYNVTNTSPRPESYLEDFRTASKLRGADQQESFYANVASGAETGWDFSTRWMPEFSTSLQLILTNSIVPVDLNSILYAVERTMSQLHMANGDDSKIAAQYANAAQNRKEAIESVLWDAGSLKWRDFNWKRSAFQHGPDQFYASNFLPLWARAISNISASVADAMVSNDESALSGFPGGVPTSLVSSGQQWDFPNAWAPLQLFIIESLDHLSEISGSKRSSWLSYDLSRRWLISNYCAWEATSKNGAGDMFEKYDATRVGLPGGGGEYDVQTGFGWTNGVALKLLTRLAAQHDLGSITCPTVE